MSKLAGATVLCGAGVSIPSGMPDGQRIARTAFDLIWRRARAFDPRARQLIVEALKWSAPQEPELRLELMLELLANELDPAVLVRVFALLERGAPNVNHVALALSGARRIVTTNQDLLLEEAGRRVGRRRRVLHLHGRFDDPRSIITLLSQYVEGLPPTTNDALLKAVDGRRLVVVGYSGRDRDVMPLLASARSITWVHHKTRGRRQAQLATEVGILSAQLGRRFEVEVADTTSFLLDQLNPAARRRARRWPAPPRARRRLPAQVRREYDSLPALGREHAIARILLHVSAPDLALEGVRAARSAHGDGADGRMLEADALLALNQRAEAIHAYHLASDLADDPGRRCAALQNEAHALANSSNYAAARRRLDQARRAVRRVEEGRTRLRLRGRIAALAGRMKGMTDDEPGAMRDYARARRAFRAARDLDGIVEATTFGSDMLRSRGRYHEALNQLAEIFTDTELYTRPYARAWAPFYRGAIVGAMGDPRAGLADLEQAETIARATGNEQAVAWAEVMIANYLREIDLDAAHEALRRCAGAIRAYRGPMFHCEARLAWEHAELARARGDEAGVRSQVADVRRMLNSPAAPGPLPYMEAHLLAVEGELARDLGHPSARPLLKQARAAYRAYKWAACVARVDVSLWLLRGDAAPPRLLARCRREGYGYEIERLESTRGEPYYPLHTL
jgi:tetratricopeptide (TPR) repeat protein